MSRDILFELGVEELPSAAVLRLSNALGANLSKALDTARLTYDDVQTFATPRRIAVIVKSVQLEQAPHQVLKLGPKKAAGFDAAGAPTPALAGFARSCGVPVDDLVVQNTPKGERFAYEATEMGLRTAELLPGLIEEAIKALPIAKLMRWGSGDEGFVRPVHWVVLLLGKDVIEFSCFGCASGRETYGHRYHHPQAITLESPLQYVEALAKADVIAGFSARREAIKASVLNALKDIDATALMSDDLLNEVTAIVEWPVALLVDFSPEFLNIPEEVLIASMQQHQKCFAVKNASGALLPHFITVSNIKSLNEAQVVHGNERVMHARLSDAAFFYAEDKKQPLAARMDGTKKVVFQSELGSLYDKTTRMKALVSELSHALHLDEADAQRALALSKCDLLTGMVGEFPELEGLMGADYALHDGEKPDVAAALKAQYLPRFSADALPSSPLGLVLSLADRLDTLVGIFGIGQKPTGEKDPFKLRRHALAVIRLLNAMPVSFDISHLLGIAKTSYGKLFAEHESLVDEVKQFILERLPAFYQGMPHAVSRVRAVLAKQSECLRDLDVRIQSLDAFEAKPEARALAEASKRVSKLLKQANLSLDTDGVPEVNTDVFLLPAEKALFEKVQALETFVTLQHAERAYGAILLELASLHVPVRDFFDAVMVMVDDKRVKTNRLNLLARLQGLLQAVVDVSLIA